VLPNVTAAMSGNTYYITAANTYGGPVQSAVATLTVIGGPPQIEVDLNPTYVAYPGGSVTLSATIQGTLPITYGWSHNGTPLSNGGQYSGANSNTLTIADAVPSLNAGTYQLFATNSHGSTNSVLATLSFLPTQIGFFGGANWSSNVASGTFSTPLFNGSNSMILTDGAGSEDRGGFFSSPLYVGGFLATYTYSQNAGVNGADGVAFVLQNDPRGAAALGGGGGQLGFVGITPSVGFCYNIYTGNGFGGIGAEFGEDGNLGQVFATGGVSLSAGDNILTSIQYLNGILSITMQDTNVSASFTTNMAINIPAILGTNVAYVGITGADGGVAATQIVTNFTYLPIVGLATAVSGNNLTLSWPSGTGAYTLQQNSTVNGTSPWTVFSGPVTTVNGQNQVTVPLTGARQFYRLYIPPGE